MTRNPPPLVSTDDIGSLSGQNSCPVDPMAAGSYNEILNSHPIELENLLAGGLLDDVLSDAPYLRALFNACSFSLTSVEADPILTERTSAGLGLGGAARGVND